MLSESERLLLLRGLPSMGVADLDWLYNELLDELVRRELPPPTRRPRHQPVVPISPLSIWERRIEMRPTIGRIVIYRSRTGDYDVPAIVTATLDTLNPKGVELGHIPALSSPDHIHLTCFTAGKPGLRRGAEDFLVESEHPRSENVSGCYQEWDIGPSKPVLGEGHAPGTWRWPERV